MSVIVGLFVVYILATGKYTQYADLAKAPASKE